MIVLVTGSRYATWETHATIIKATIIWAAGKNEHYQLWDGSAEGADAIGRRIGKELGWANRPFSATWAQCDPEWEDPIKKAGPCQPHGHRKERANRQEYCPTAGHRRNQRMVDALLLAEDRKVCVAFPIPDLGSFGTEDCITRAMRAKIPTVIVPLDSAG